MSLGAGFAEVAASEPRAMAVVDGATRLSYGEWQPRILAVAGALRGLGLGAGDRLLAVLSNRWETATLYWACQMAGIVFTPFNWRAAADEIAFVVGDAEPGAVAYESVSRDAVLAAGPEAATIDIDDFAALLAASPLPGPVAVAPQAGSLMLYTSGTTGRPKGVPRSHAAEHAAGRNAIVHLDYRRGECQLGVMPLFHTMGIRQLQTSALLAGRWLAMARFEPAGALALIANERVSALFLVPTLFHDLVEHPAIAAADLSGLRVIATAGMSMSAALVARCAEVLRPQRFHNFYGSSEIFTFTVCDRVTEKPGCAGKPGLGQNIRIVGEAGEIVASMASPEAFAGYWNRPDADRRAIRDGWFFTGDLGRLDDDGDLYVLGRVDDMIISGGENIHPEEVEDVLARSPLVREAAVIGTADARWGDRVTACVVPADDRASAAALDRFCLASGLARFKRPRAYVFVAALPRSATGKLLRRRVRDGDYETLAGFDATL